MSDFRIENNDYIRYTLSAKGRGSIILDREPIGWGDDIPELIRHDNYKGMFIEFSSPLTFKDDALEYIESLYLLNGVNAKLFLTKEELRKGDQYKDGLVADENDKINWEIVYIGIADYFTKNIKDHKLTIRFNSNDLETLIENQQDNVFELERTDSIDENAIQLLDKRELLLKARGLENFSTWILKPSDVGANYYVPNNINSDISPRAALVINGPARSRNVDLAYINNLDRISMSANMFYVDSVNIEFDVDLLIEWDFSFTGNADGVNGIDVVLERWRFNIDAEVYELYDELFIAQHLNGNLQNPTEDIGSIQYSQDNGNVIKFNDGFILALRPTSTPVSGYGINATVFKWDIKITQRELAPTLDNSPFIFLNTAIGRLMEIITGEQGRFYSRLLGRINDTEFGNFQYDTSGKYAFVGLISGFWIRSFPIDDEKYKSLQISIKDFISSLQSVFNIGVGTDIINGKQVLRIEDLRYFYQNKVVVKLTEQVTDVGREVDEGLHFNAIELGYNKGGDYEEELGLDEPNVATEHITPLRVGKNRYIKKSNIRSDEYGLELIRQKPYSLFPLEDTAQDTHNWFLDIKATPPSTGISYTQNEWDDRLEYLPEGILFPETFRSAFFIPSRLLFRHGWIIRSCIEQAINFTKNIKYINSKTNSTLKTHFIGEDTAYVENEDVPIADLDRPRFLPEIITFNHEVNKDLYDLIKGRTEIMIEGSLESVPNVYFQFEWINENEEIERGYLLSLKPNNKGEFKMQKVNDNLIF